MASAARPALLDYSSLRLLDDPENNHSLGIRSVDIQRLGDDLGEIELGETIPFVLVAEFYAVPQTYVRLGAAFKREVAVGDTMFAIDKFGNITSIADGIDANLDDLARWVRDRFKFAIKVRGVEREGRGRDQIDYEEFATVTPWIFEINTNLVRGEVLELDAYVTAKPVVPGPTPPPRGYGLLSKTDALLAFDQGEVEVSLEITGKYEDATKLAQGNYWVALHSDDGPDLRVAVKVIDVTPNAKLLPGKPATATPATKKPTAALKAKNTVVQDEDNT